MRVRNMVGAIVLATAVFAAGCGDDGETTDASTGAGSSGGGAVSASAWCVDGEKMGDSFDDIDINPTMTSGDMKKTFSDVAASFKKLADQAPGEIKADVKIFSDALASFNSTLAKYDYDFVKIAADPKAVEAFAVMEDPKIEQASKNIEAWVEKNCPGATK